jgi:hypothetical protein
MLDGAPNIAEEAETGFVEMVKISNFNFHVRRQQLSSLSIADICSSGDEQTRDLKSLILARAG